MDVQPSRREPRFLSNRLTTLTEARPLPVNHRSRAVCVEISKMRANGRVGILYKNQGADSAAGVAWADSLL